MKFGFFALSALALAATGCSKETVSSANIRTKGIAATIVVTGSASGSSEVEATLRVGGDESNTYVMLEGGDKLVAKAAEETKDMHAESEGVYLAQFATNAQDTPFTVSLLRGEDEDAPDNTVSLPAPFTIGALPTTSPSRASDDLTVTWDPATGGDSMRMEVKGDCIFSKKFSIPGDSGSFVIAKGQLDSTGGSEPKACDLTITLWRTRKGTTDIGLDRESSIEASQRRTATFTSAP